MIALTLLVFDVVWMATGSVPLWLGVPVGALVFDLYLGTVIDYARRPR